jgi:hypothetical protein
MEQEPNEDIKRRIEDITRRIAVRFEAWNRAAEEHLVLKPGSVPNLATGWKAWRHLQAIDPAWRERDTTISPEIASLEEIIKFLNFRKLQIWATDFHQQKEKAFLIGGEEGRRFARQLSKAFAIPEDQIRWKISLNGEVLLTWMEITYQRCKAYVEGTRLDWHTPPRDHEIRSRVDRLMNEQRPRPIADRTWQRVWEDSFIAALLRCP